MIIKIKVPSPGESITEVEIANWQVSDGDIVEKDQDIAEIESDKATLALTAEEAGEIKIFAQEGETVEVGKIICTIDTSKAGSAPVIKKEDTQVPEEKSEQATEKEILVTEKPDKGNYQDVKISPLAGKLMQEHHLSVDDVIKGLRRINKKDIELIAGLPKGESSAEEKERKPISGEHSVRRKKMTSLRRKLSERLVAVKNETAMLTTFNEVDMSAVMDLRNKYKLKFQEKHGVKLGFMSFFTKAAAKALKEHPMVNSYIDGDEILTPDYIDIAIAVQTPKGLMVPVLRNTESQTIAQIEQNIAKLAEKARNGKLTIDEMTGGTFTITNGGVFGSMMSTPIINPPQSGILGMHNIVERPVAINGNVEIRPMMYLALSYDHRVIDGKDSVGFLVKLKQYLENPYELLIGDNNADNKLLDL